MSAQRIVLTLVEYAYGEATFEDDSGDARLVLPLRHWELLGRAEVVHVDAAVTK